MMRNVKLWAWISATLAGVLMGDGALAQQAAFPTDPKLPEGQTRQVAPHTWVIMGFPNIGIVVGEKATLVVDTGLGNANGALVAREARRLSTRGQRLILTTTHIHPEHASGQGAFPKGTLVVRNKAQEDEMVPDGQNMMGMFGRGAGPMAELMKDAALLKADETFDRERDLDLGGVHVKLFWFGAAHTRGDEIIYVAEDHLLLPGDVVQNHISPNIICGSCSPRQWLAVVDQVAKLDVRQVVPDHGDLGGAELIGQQRAFLADLDSQALKLKQDGVPVAEAGKRIQAEFEKTHADWKGLGNIPMSVRKAYDDPRQ